MEGVEDIPGTALHEGIDWKWETFPEYLDALEAMPRVDGRRRAGAARRRAGLRARRAGTTRTPTPPRSTQMARLVREGVDAGAIGFTTSRTVLHSSKHGYMPGTSASADELLAIGDAIGEAGHGVFEVVTDHAESEDERDWMVQLARSAGATVTYGLAQTPWAPKGYREALADAGRLADEGIRVTPQVACRPTGMLFGLQSSLHPFITHPSYREVADLPLSARVAALSEPERRARLVSEEPGTNNMIARTLMTRWEQIFPLGDPPDYEPPPERSVAATAERSGRTPQDVVLDWLLEADGTALLFAPLASYVEHDHEAIREMITDEHTILGLSDGGAHCGLICDASMPTYLLTHWVRDRTRGERLPLELAVHLQTGRTAAAYGLVDRGTIEVGKRADLNLIDLEGLRLHAPEMVFDLPAGGRRLVQRVDGYRATIVAGVVTYADGEPTGARPGQLVRMS